MGKHVVSQPRLGEDAGGGTAEARTLRIERDFSHVCAHEMVDAVKYLIGSQTSEIAIDLADVATVDSSGLDALIVCRSICAQADVGFRLARVSESVARIIRQSGFSWVFGLSDPEHAGAGCLQRVCHGPVYWRTCEHAVTSNAEAVSVLRDKVAVAADEAGADPETLCDIKIAVGEALTNAYRHGSPQKDLNKVELRCMSCSAAFVVEVQDEGHPFDPDATPEPDPTTLSDHGMGIYLIRQAMDVVEFSSGNPGNIVRMVKWLGGQRFGGSIE